MKDDFVVINGMKIHYLEAGNKNENKILLIHGLGSSAERWYVVQNDLSKNYHVLSVDLPGFGKSDKPSSFEYTIAGFGDIIIEFMKQRLDDVKINLVGHSLGGYIALDVASKTKSVNKLVLIDSSGMLKGLTPLLQEYLHASINPTTENVRGVFEKMVVDPKRIQDNLVDGFISRINAPGAKHSFKMTLDNSANYPIDSSKLSKITIPTLILWGKCDVLIPIDHAYLFKKKLVNSRLEIIPDSGHAPFAEKPYHVTKLIDSFLC